MTVLTRGAQAGNTALTLAARDGNWTIVDLLLSHGASLEARNNVKNRVYPLIF